MASNNSERLPLLLLPLIADKYARASALVNAEARPCKDMATLDEVCGLFFLLAHPPFAAFALLPLFIGTNIAGVLFDTNIAGVAAGKR